MKTKSKRMAGHTLAGHTLAGYNYAQQPESQSIKIAGYKKQIKELQSVLDAERQKVTVMAKGLIPKDVIEPVKPGWEAAPWIKVSERLPELIKNKDYSDNVFAFENGEIKIMAYVWIQDGDHSGYCWANCYGDINGDAHFDDEYNVTHWMYLPPPPKPNQL